MDFLEPPLIQLGVYWHGLGDCEAFRRMLAWLRDRGSRPAGDMFAFRNRGGKLPRFQSLYLPRPPGQEEGCVSDRWSVEEVLNSRDWLPAALRLRSAPPAALEFDLEYGPLGDDSFRSGDMHPIQISISGALPNLLDNVPAGTLPPKKARVARQILGWSRTTFRAICGELAPSYAAYHWERCLDGPASLFAVEDFRDFIGFFVSDRLGSFERLARTLGSIRRLSIERYRTGSYISSDRPDELTEAERMTLVQSLRVFLKEGLIGSSR
jgi:hypothetical protein